MQRLTHWMLATAALAAWLGLAAAAPALCSDQPQSQDDRPADPPPDAAAQLPPPMPHGDIPAHQLDYVKVLLRQLERLHTEVDNLRAELTEARLEAGAANEELAELKQFLADHHELGQDFDQYRALKATAEDESRQRRAVESRRARELARVERLERMKQARADRDQQRSEEDRLDFYRRRGFGGIGLDVFLSRMAYSYQTVDATSQRIDYSPGFGHYLRLYPGLRIDFSAVTISGSVLNAAEEVRNIGIAITFFDEVGNQVGHETVEVTNARPDVPYPFTETIPMALDRPFASSSQYVLYADPVE